MSRPETGPGNSPETRLEETSSTGASLPLTAPPVEAADRSNNWLKGVLETLGILREWFPPAFSAGRPRPLKVGIHKDLAEKASAISTGVIARAMRYHTQSDRYLRALKPGAARVDLDGNAVGEVTADEAAFAQVRLGRVKERVKAKAQAAKAAGSAASASPAPTATTPHAGAAKAASAPAASALRAREAYRRARGWGVRI